MAQKAWVLLMKKQRMGHKPISSFIEFRDGGTSPSGITKIWYVVNTMSGQDDQIGYIRWHGAWRKYVYQVPDESFYDWECLRFIADFIEARTIEHREARKNGS